MKSYDVHLNIVWGDQATQEKIFALENVLQKSNREIIVVLDGWGLENLSDDYLVALAQQKINNQLPSIWNIDISVRRLKERKVAA